MIEQTSFLRSEHRSTGVAVDRVNREKDDFYPTPPRATLALLGVEQFVGPIWEPSCGEGHISKVLLAAGHEVFSSDLVDRGYGEPRIDFLMEYKARAPNLITNPPFKLATEFMRHATSLSTAKVALLLRLACLEGIERGEVYDTTPLARIHCFRKRLSMYRRGEDMKAGGTLAFAWFVWDSAHSGAPTFHWLP